MTQLTTTDKIAIVEIAFYIPAFFIATLLCWRHGFGRSAGWFYLIILSLMRVIGGGMELGTINDPTNLNLIIGAQTLQNVGLSPLILTMLGLVSRVYMSIADGMRPAIPNSRILRVLQILVVVGLVLSIVGGVNTGNQIGADINSGQPLTYQVSNLSQGGVGCMIGGFALLAISAVLLLLTQLRNIPRSETHLLFAVGAALPFVLVRLVYSILSVFDTSSPNFRQYGGSADAPYYVAGMCTAMEIVAVVIFEAVGLTIPYVSRSDRKNILPMSQDGHSLMAYPDTSYQAAGAPQGQNGYYPK